MSKVAQVPPTSEIIQVCRLIDEAMRRFVFASRNVLALDAPEAHMEAYALLGYSIRFIQSISTLAQTDLVLLPASLTLARTISDASIKVLWMLHSDDLYECEARWLTVASEQTKYFENIAKLFEVENGAYAQQMRERGDEIKLRHDRTKEALELTFPNKYQPRKDLPKIHEMLTEIDRVSDYWNYRFGSQFTHASAIATALYRSHDTLGKPFREFVEPDNWRTCFEMLWTFFEPAAIRFLERCGSRPDSFCTSAQSDTIQHAIAAIK